MNGTAAVACCARFRLRQAYFAVDGTQFPPIETVLLGTTRQICSKSVTSADECDPFAGAESRHMGATRHDKRAAFFGFPTPDQSLANSIRTLSTNVVTSKSLETLQTRLGVTAAVMTGQLRLYLR